MKFNLFRYFSASGAVVILLLATSLWWFFSNRSENQLVATVEHDNIVLATLLAGEISRAFPEHFAVSHTPNTLSDDHHRRHIPEIDRKLRGLVENTPILAVNVFWNDLTIFSTQAELIGTTKKSKDFLIARKGKNLPARLF